MNRVAYLDGIRAIAIGAVLIVHWVASQFPGAFGGYIGVDIFFVLSGYIITTMLWKKKPAGRVVHQYGAFLRRRVIRLYPALLGFVVATLVIYAVFPGAPMAVSELVVPAVMALVQGYSFYAASEVAVASPFAITWSLSIEWVFYLLWPLAILRLKRSGIAAPVVAKWTIVAAALLYVAALPQNEHWFYYGPVARVSEIMLGGALGLMMSASIHRERPPLRPHLLGFAALAALGFLAAYTLLGPVQWSPVFRYVGLPFTVAATLYLIWFGIRSPRAAVTRFLGWGPLALLGRVSYSLYLWHMVGLGLFTRDNLGSMPLPVIALLAVGFSVVMTALSYRFLELPFMRSQGSILRSGPRDSAQDSNAKITHHDESLNAGVDTGTRHTSNLVAPGGSGGAQGVTPLNGGPSEGEGSEESPALRG
jgi:peptidoglycan/LPS O-acetylase OafA/YrhL